MIEYPSIINSSKAPRRNCMAFSKLDGSNIRVKYTKKKGFHLFGSRTQLFDENHSFLAPAIPYFYTHLEPQLINLIESEFPNEREVIAFFEFFGDKSFAGTHDPEDTSKRLICFDLMIGHKNRKFLLPQKFIKLAMNYNISIPDVLYEGNLSDSFIQDVKNGKYDVNEGVICKGTERSGAYCGHVWMCKIKTSKYLNKIYEKYGEDGIKKFGE